jgi:hypothetical protein
MRILAAALPGLKTGQEDRPAQNAKGRKRELGKIARFGSAQREPARGFGQKLHAKTS